MENLFKMEGLKKASLDYKNKPCDNLDLEIVDAFYIYEYIIKQELPKIIKNYEKSIRLIFSFLDGSMAHGETPSFKVHWYFTYGPKIDFDLINASDEVLINGRPRPNPTLAKNKNIKINKKTFDLLIQFFENFMKRYELGYFYKMDGTYSKTEEVFITTNLYQLIDAFYSEWQRIDYEAKEIIEDYQKEYGIDRKVLLPGESDINVLKRKK